MISPSPIFRFGASLLTPILLLLSLVICWRGHQLPGGGFVGGLVASTAFVIHAICWDTKTTLRMMRLRPQTILYLGLVVMLSGALGPVFLGQAFFEGVWISIPVLGQVGTPVLFDFGVYLIVIGAVCTSIFTLMEENL